MELVFQTVYLLEHGGVSHRPGYDRDRSFSGLTENDLRKKEITDLPRDQVGSFQWKTYFKRNTFSEDGVEILRNS